MHRMLLGLGLTQMTQNKSCPEVVSNLGHVAMMMSIYNSETSGTGEYCRWCGWGGQERVHRKGMFEQF